MNKTKERLRRLRQMHGAKSKDYMRAAVAVRIDEIVRIETGLESAYSDLWDAEQACIDAQ